MSKGHKFSAVGRSIERAWRRLLAYYGFSRTDESDPDARDSIWSFVATLAGFCFLVVSLLQVSSLEVALLTSVLAIIAVTLLAIVTIRIKRKR